jgi:hypothetical protein
MKYLKKFESYISADGQLQDFFNDLEMDDSKDLDMLNGKYQKANAEINTRLQTVSIGHNFYISGHEAMEVIGQIYDIWQEEGCDREDAVMLWYDHNAL